MILPWLPLCSMYMSVHLVSGCIEPWLTDTILLNRTKLMVSQLKRTAWKNLRMRLGENENGQGFHHTRFSDEIAPCHATPQCNRHQRLIFFFEKYTMSSHSSLAHSGRGWGKQPEIIAQDLIGSPTARCGGFFLYPAECLPPQSYHHVPQPCQRSAFVRIIH